MGINIWLPILVNLLILGIMVAGAFIGKKNGFLYEFLKLVILCGCGVGIYFLNPIIVNLILGINFINELIVSGLVTLEIIKAITFMLLFIVGDILVTIIFKIIRAIINNKHTINKAKPAKIIGLTKKDTKRLRKEHKNLIKNQKKEYKLSIRKLRTKKSKVFGILFGAIVAFVLVFAIMLPLKPIFKQITETQPELVEIEKGFEYTPYGQIDNVTDIVNLITK